MTLKKVYQTKDIYPNFQSEHDSVESDITADLAKLKFFCGNATPTRPNQAIHDRQAGEVSYQ